MDPNNNPYQPQDPEDDQQAGQQPPVTDGDLASFPQQHSDFSHPQDAQNAQDAQHTPYTGPPADDMQATNQLPPPDEIPADEHYMEPEQHISAHNPQQVETPVDHALHTEQTPEPHAKVPDEAVQNPLAQPEPAEPQENTTPQQSYDQHPAPEPYEPPAQFRQYNNAEPASTDVADQQVHDHPQPVPDYGSQNQEENEPQPLPPAEQEQQVPWWEMRPPEEEEDAGEAAYQAQLPPKPAESGQDSPAIHTFKRRRPGDQDAQPAAETAPQPDATQPSSLDFALPPIQQPPGQPGQAPDINPQGTAGAQEPVADGQISSQQDVHPEPVTTGTPTEAASPQESVPGPFPPVQAETQSPAHPMPAAPPEPSQPPPVRQADHSTYQLPPSAAQPTANQSAATPPQEPAPTTEQAQPAVTETNTSFKSKLLKLFAKFKNLNYKPMVSAAVLGIVIFGVFNAQVIIGQVQYLTTPAGGLNTASGTVDADAPVGDKARIIIPRVNVDVPVVYDEPSFKEEKVQQALERGVVHYGNTAVPGEKGNNVIVGHSSNNWWDSGKYKFAFILLDKLQDGDEIVLHYEGERYVYEVHKKFVVEPTDVSVLAQNEDPIITLITCTPPGTSWQRLIVQARQVSPDPAESVDASRQTSGVTEALPSDSRGGGFFNFLRSLF